MNFKKYRIISLFFFLAIPSTTFSQSTTEPIICHTGYLQGDVPATQIPDYIYTPDGFLELHFRLTTTKWRYNYGRFLLHNNNCQQQVLYSEGVWGSRPNQSSSWPAVNHVLLRFYEAYPGFYRFNVFNGDTGVLMPLDESTNQEILWVFSGSSGNYSIGPVVRLIFGNRDSTDFSWDTETGDLISTPALSVRIIPTKTPVLIVPGLLGTDMYKGSEKLWLDLGHNFTDVGDTFMDPLQLNSNLTPLDASLVTGDVIRIASMTPETLVNFDYTKGLIDLFTSPEVGYTENVNLFTFPYDWRYGVSGVFGSGKTNVDLLRQKIQEIITQTGSSKVDVIAHSNGGLLVKKYVMDNVADHRVGKAIFLGVPNTGAPKAIKGLLQGDNFGIPWLADGEMQKIATNLPVMYDLLPSQQYFNVKGSYIRIINQGLLLNSSSQDLDFTQANNFLINDHSLNNLALTNAHALHTTNFDNFDLRSAGVDLYSIDGCKAGTIGKIIERRRQLSSGGTSVSYDQPHLVPGDGTVPLESATNLPINQDHKFYALKANHGKMPSQDGIRQQVVNTITGSQIPIAGGLMTQDESLCKLKGKAISVYSPVNITIIDGAGNTAGLSDDGSSIQNTIPNADFAIIGEHKFAYLPEDDGQTYSISLEGTGDGTFTLQNQNIDNSHVTQTETFADVPVTLSLSGQVNVGSGTTTVSLDTDGDNVVDQIIQPSSVIYPDKISPESIINFDPVTKDLRFAGIDNVSSSSDITISDNSGHVVLTDLAGNTLDIGFAQTNRRTAMKASIQSLSYNDQLVAIDSNSLSFIWRLDSAGVVKSLTQVVKSSQYSIKAVYDGTKTTLTGTDQTGRISKSINGLALLKVSTNKGDFIWTY